MGTSGSVASFRPTGKYLRYLDEYRRYLLYIYFYSSQRQINMIDEANLQETNKAAGLLRIYSNVSRHISGTSGVYLSLLS